jgi:hypothetical protein
MGASFGSKVSDIGFGREYACTFYTSEPSNTPKLGMGLTHLNWVSPNYPTLKENLSYRKHPLRLMTREHINKSFFLTTEGFWL